MSSGVMTFSAGFVGDSIGEFDVEVDVLEARFWFRHVIRLRVGRKTATAHVGAIFTRGAGNNFAQVGVLPGEFRHWPECQTKQIVDHKNLPIALRTCSNADRW